MSYSIKRYTNKFYDQWNGFVEDSNNGTIFHRMDFLNYHGHKFKSNEHSLVFFKGDSIVALMPLSIYKKKESKIAKSPFGASFGGIVCKSKISLSAAVKIIESLIDYLKVNNISECIVQTTPWYYHKKVNNYLEFAMLKKGFTLESRDLFNTIELPSKYEDLWSSHYEGRCRTTIKKRENQFKIINNVDVNEFYKILIEDKKRHNNSQPTHSLLELKFLVSIFPERIWFEIAIHKETKAKAAICYFKPVRNCLMTFYMCQENDALKLDGKNILIDSALKKAIHEGIKYFDFGGSSIGYDIENYGVSKFKESFGAKGYFRDKFKLMI